MVLQKKTGRPVQFEIIEPTRLAIDRSLPLLRQDGSPYLFQSRSSNWPHISTRQYSRIVHRWFRNIGLDHTCYGTHSLRRTKVTHLYRQTGNLRAVELLLGHTKIETTVRYLGVEVDDALQLAENLEL